MQADNHFLMAELKRYRKVPGLVEAVAASVGVAEEELKDPQEVAIKSFFLRPGEQVFSCYLVTDGVFALHQRTLNGNVLTITLPLSRIRRVVEDRIEVDGDPRVHLVVEFEADRMPLSLRGPTLTEPNQNNSNQRNGIMELSGFLTGSTYEVLAESLAEDAKVSALARGLRRALR